MNEDIIKQARELRRKGWSWNSIARHFGIGYDKLRYSLDPDYASRRRARHHRPRRGPTPRTTGAPAKWTQENLDELERDHLAGMSKEELAQKHGMSVAGVLNVLYRVWGTADHEQTNRQKAIKTDDRVMAALRAAYPDGSPLIDIKPRKVVLKQHYERVDLTPGLMGDPVREVA